MSALNRRPEVAANDVIAAASLQQGEDCSDPLRAALNAVGEHASHDETRLLVAKRLGEVTSATGAGFLAVWLGAGVEGGADPDLTGGEILRSMLHWASLVESLPEEDPQDEDQEIADPEVAPEIVTGLEMHGRGLVAHLSRSPTLLKQTANDAAIVAELERVEYASAGPMWVLELLRKRSGTLIVIHVQDRRGFHLNYHHLSNCFHLFSLLQAALADAKLTGSKPVAPVVLSVAKGEAMEDCSDSAFWHYGIGSSASAELGGSIWGEANPESIPAIDGQQVILLWPPILGSRQWGAGFFHPFIQATPPNVEVTAELTSNEVEQWFQKLNLPKLSTSPWWKFW